GWWQTMTLELPPHLAKAGNFQFLTNASLTVATLYLIVNLASPNARVLTPWHHLVSNLEFVVTTAYWTMILCFPHHLNTDSFEFDLALDLKIHLLPYVYLLLDRKPMVSFVRSAAQSVAFIGVYWAAIELHVYLNQDGITLYPYPLLNGIGVWGRLKWMGVFMGLSVANY
ncbi:uncharacterized protein CANTADRAFT_33238, partial [Suhomyces tanzawaensis NRRL Y-17324]